MAKRKWVLPIVIGLVGVGIIAGIFIAKANLKNDFNDHISEVRDVIYKGEMDGNKITAISGKRETNYLVDGQCNGTDDFLIVTLEGKFVKVPVYCISIDGKEYTGSMQKHPFNDEYSCELNVRISLSEFDVKINVDNVEKTVKLHSIVSNSFISSDEALQKSREVLSSALDGFDGEIYVRLIENPLKSDDTYFWYVAFYSQNDDIKSVLLDVVTGEAVAVKRD